jgi:hypothetical protein
MGRTPRIAVKSAVSTTGVAVLLLAVLPTPVYAYLDPVSGSIILQVIAAGVFAGVMTTKRYWAHLKRAFGNLRERLSR